jgi:bifunctional non-homologous end joining protein LigD
MPNRTSAVAEEQGLARYRARRDFTATPEPAPPRRAAKAAKAPIFVVQKHAARRLHWDFRLEHGGVLWSWAVPKGPSLDPADKRLAVQVEDHPLDYADFQGRIPEGQYGAGTVETWDRGTWRPVGDAEAGLRDGELKFELDGNRLHGHFVLVRLKPRPKDRTPNWLLIKEHDDQERKGADAGALEAVPVTAKAKGAPAKPARKEAPARGKATDSAKSPPAPGAVRGKLPHSQEPELATPVEASPHQPGWLSEVKFDGYRLLVFLDRGTARLVSRNGHDWTQRLPTVAREAAALHPGQALLDTELVALRKDGVSNFGDLQAALSEGKDGKLFLYAFDLLHLDGWDLRPCRLVDRKAVLRDLGSWDGTLRFSEHYEGDAARLRQRACEMGLEGVMCKRADSPYRAGRSTSWVKVKCVGREEFIIIGWTPPQGSRTGIGSLHMGYRDRAGALHYAGGVGTGFSEQVLADLRRRLEPLKAARPAGLVRAGDPPDRAITWVRPEMVGEVQYAAWTGAGRLRHATFLGLREDKPAEEVVRDIPDPEPLARPTDAPPPAPKPRARIVSRSADPVGGIRLTHPDRELWPGITKRDLADYWLKVAEHALPEIAGRPLALVRCPDGIDGEHFFQKHARKGFPEAIRAGESGGAPWLAVDDAAGLVACAQQAAIELHAWGAAGADPLHPDRLVFDLDPGDGVDMEAIAAAAHDIRKRLGKVGLAAFCRTSGGKGLHVVAPLVPAADWDKARAWCRAFAERMEHENPDRYVAAVRKDRRRGRILVDWLRNGLGSTAVASFSPRARPGATVATRLAWREVTGKLDPGAFTIKTVPQRAARRADPWAEFVTSARKLPEGDG